MGRLQRRGQLKREEQISPTGMSGGAVFDCGYFFGENNNPVLVGILIEVHRKPKLMLATETNVIVDWLNAGKQA
jgi:hypothetical protein